CSACITICPAKVLVLDRKNGSNIIRINDKLCITCFCCHEVCPAKAISVGRAPIRIVHRRLPVN
ncbi:MAG: 4Fe-4S dicluster domain-containing protein, partial [Spirochaetia bacterium]|nr:4Fe-4S dicluster domain-containing protein [Spirochaetia bacterium]